MLNKVFEAQQRVFVFGARASSGYSSGSRRSVNFLPAFGVKNVPEGENTITIDHFLDQSGLGMIITPNWNTTVFWKELLPDSATFGFGSQAPVGAHVFWEASIMPLQNVTVGDQFIDISHNQNDIDISIFATTNWNTAVFDSIPDRTLNTARLYFSSQAQGAEPQIVWKTSLEFALPYEGEAPPEPPEPEIPPPTGIVIAAGTASAGAMATASGAATGLWTVRGTVTSSATVTGHGAATGVLPRAGSVTVITTVTTHGIKLAKATGTVTAAATVTATGTSTTVSHPITQLMPTGYPGRRYR